MGHSIWQRHSDTEAAKIMPAIITRYIAATRARPARVRASAVGHNWLDYPCPASCHAAHAAAALAYAQRKRLPVDLVGAELSGTLELVWLSASSALEARTVTDSACAGRSLPAT